MPVALEIRSHLDDPLPQRGDDEIDLVPRYDQRRRHDVQVHDRPHHQAELVAGIGHDLADIQLLGKQGMAGLVLDELQPAHQAFAPDMGHYFKVLQRLEPFAEICACFAGVLHQAFAFHDFDILQGGGAADRMAGVGVA